MSNARVLLFDIETAPNVSYTWGKYDQNVVKFKQEWFMLCFGWKWLDEKRAHVAALPDFPGYEKDRSNDRNLVLALRRLIDEADVVIAHNGDGFDMPKARARWLIHGITPPSPVKTIDTLKVARRQALFNSNKLGDLAETLGLPTRKGDTGGFDTWLGCMAGDEKAWKRMTRYCRQDVYVLEDVYTRLLPFIPNPPNLATLSGDGDACPKCGVSGGMVKKGYIAANVQTYRRYRCSACGGWSRGRLPVKDFEKPNYT